MEKQTGFQDGCFGPTQILGHAVNLFDCNDLSLQSVAGVSGTTIAIVGYLYHAVMIFLLLTELTTSKDPGAYARNLQLVISSAATAIAIYLVIIQFRYGKFCIICLANSTLVATQFTLLIISIRNSKSLSADTDGGRYKSDVRCVPFIFLYLGLTFGWLIFFKAPPIATGNLAKSGAMSIKQSHKSTRPVVQGENEFNKGNQPPESILKIDDWGAIGRPFIGVENAIPFVVFLDPNCVHCKSYYDKALDLYSRFESRIRLHIIPRPLWKYSDEQVQALQISKDYGLYFKLWQLMFDRQKPGGMKTSEISILFEALGVKVDDLATKLANYPISPDTLRARAMEYSITSTPAFYLNGIKLTATDLIPETFEDKLTAK